MVPIPEGQWIVACPFCNLRSLVKGEHDLQRYQVAKRIERPQALEAMSRFFTGHRAIASNIARQVSLEEAFVAYLPFWASWGRGLGWVFGQKRVGSGNDAHYEPREVKTSQELSWNGAACDVGEFGVTQIPLQGRPLEPFEAQSLHQAGLVFEPVGSASDARATTEAEFQNRLRNAANLDRIGQVFTRIVNKRMGLVYYPLWVLRYLYRGRSFQVVVDGFSGEVLYGKAPGSTLYRAAMLVGGMALGALVGVDGGALAFYLASQSKGDSGSGLFFAGIAALVIGFGLMAGAYRAFRFGEQYEYRKGGTASLFSMQQSKQILSQIEGLASWTNRSN